MLLLGALLPSAIGPGTIRSLAESGGGASAGSGGGGGNLLGGLGPLLLVGLAIAVVIVVGALIVLFRTRGVTTAPASSEGWWTCSNCGAANMDGASRCHSCSTWRAPTTSASPRPAPLAGDQP